MASASAPEAAQPPPAKEAPGLHEVLPKAGLVYSEKGNLSEVLCKPKIMPIKSSVLQKLEEMESQAAKVSSMPYNCSRSP